MKCLWTSLTCRVLQLWVPLVLLLVYYWMPEYKGACILVTGRFFFFIHWSLDVCSGMQPRAESKADLGLWRSSMKETRVSLSMSERMPTRVFQGKGAWNTYLCLSWKRYDFPDFQIHFMSHIKFQSGCTKLSVILMFVSNCCKDAS